jgi:hypothetical protein
MDKDKYIVDSNGKYKERDNFCYDESHFDSKEGEETDRGRNGKDDKKDAK